MHIKTKQNKTENSRLLAGHCHVKEENDYSLIWLDFILTSGQLQNREEIREKYFLRTLNLDLGTVVFIQNNFNAVISKLQKILSDIELLKQS